MMATSELINQDILAILSKVIVEGKNIFLNCGQLDRKQYLMVNKVLEDMGGKWNRKLKAHIFANDPTEILEQVILSGKIVSPKEYGYFPTPPELANHIIELAAIKYGMLILEPSAGQGGIVDYIPKDCRIDCIELLPENIKILKEKGCNVIYEGNFLDVMPTPIYDRIIMNPPFEKQADIEHVEHAFQFLKSKGRLVSIMASSLNFRQNKKTLDFKKIINNYGAILQNPKDSFKASGSMVNTVVVILDNN